MASATFVYKYKNSDMDKGGFDVIASVAGGPEHVFQLDTGSSGMAIGVNYVGADYKNYPCYGPGQFKYNPSENLLQGNWYLLPVSLISADPAAAYCASSVCMVLVVTSVTDGDGKVSDDYQGGMMGVSAKGENPAYNVLLNASIPGPGGTADVELAPAYTLTQTACTIGQTHVAADGFDVVNLQPVTPPPLPAQTGSALVTLTPPSVAAWAMPSVTVTMYNASAGGQPSDQILTPKPVYSLTAALEIDTGIDTMLIVLPEGSVPSSFVGPVDKKTGQSVFIKGINIAVTATGTMQVTPARPAMLCYGFNTTVAPSGAAPTSVILMPPPTNAVGDMPRINLGIRPLNLYNYMFDGQNGLIGFDYIGKTTIPGDITNHLPVANPPS